MSIRTFDNVDDLAQAIEEARSRADAVTDDYQRAAKPGDFYVRWEEALGLVIYGEILDPIVESRKAGASEDELAYEKAMRAEPHMANFRFSRAFSLMCPDGELGDVHVSSILMLLSQEQFERAKADGWPNDLDYLRSLLGVVPTADA